MFMPVKLALGKALLAVAGAAAVAGTTTSVIWGWPAPLRGPSRSNAIQSAPSPSGNTALQQAAHYRNAAMCAYLDHKDWGRAWARPNNVPRLCDFMYDESIHL